MSAFRTSGPVAPDGNCSCRRPIETKSTSLSTTTKHKALSATSAAAISVIGFLVYPAHAQALPIPLAPPCIQYGFIGDTTINQSNGYRVEFNSTGKTAQGPAVATVKNGAQMTGAISGGVEGRKVNLAIRWDGGGVGIYTGTVDASDFAHGNTYDATSPASTANWDSGTPLGCITPPAAPPQPTQVPPPNPAPGPPLR